MTPAEQIKALKAELEAKTAELAKKSTLTLKVSQKGAVSLYGMGRFPVTLYAEQWGKVVDMGADIKAFIEANKSNLTFKTAA